MVNVSEKKASTLRIARARATVNVGKEILALLSDNEIVVKKRPRVSNGYHRGDRGSEKEHPTSFHYATRSASTTAKWTSL